MKKIIRFLWFFSPSVCVYSFLATYKVNISACCRIKEENNNTKSSRPLDYLVVGVPHDKLQSAVGADFRGLRVNSVQLYKFEWMA